MPVFMNGMGRGCLPADDPLAFARVRGLLKKEADLVVVVGTPLDFRLAFGDFGAAAGRAPGRRGRGGRARTGRWPASASGDLAAILDGLAGWAGDRVVARSRGWPGCARPRTRPGPRTSDAARPAAARSIRPPAVYGALRSRLDRDAVVIGDGGDFVSYAGKYVDSYQPGCWLDPGPYGCLGTGLGYAIAARVARPSSQVVLLLGDGAAGFSLMDVDTLVRHDLPVVMVVGNNGGWGLEKHPMRAIYGYDVAAELRPETRYDEVVRALGGAGETVRDAGRARAGAGPGVRVRRAVPGQRADRPGRRLPAVVGAGLRGGGREAKRSRSTIARVIRPVATGRPSWVTLTSKVSLRAVRSTSWASAWTVAPTGLGARWSSSTWVPTVVWPGVERRRRRARTVAASARASARGVPRTSTSPEPSARAVSASVTVVVDAGGIGRFTHARTLAQHRRLPGQ